MNVALGSCDADVEMARNGFVAETGTQEAGNLFFPPSQRPPFGAALQSIWPGR